MCGRSVCAVVYCVCYGTCVCVCVYVYYRTCIYICVPWYSRCVMWMCGIPKTNILNSYFSVLISITFTLQNLTNEASKVGVNKFIL